jgi:ribosomal protein S28E/S33
MTNQYFTPRREAINEAEVPLTSDIDPMGILAGHGKNQFIHCEQNVVKYYNRKTIQGGAIKLVLIRIFEQTNAESAIRYEVIPPVRFRVGDIVEIKGTLMLIPL